jgi:hypothetical protein
MKIFDRLRNRVPEHAHGERTSSFGSGYFAVIKDERPESLMEPGERDMLAYARRAGHDTRDQLYKIVDVPLKEPLPDGWVFAERGEAHDFIVGIESGNITSTMFRLV